MATALSNLLALLALDPSAYLEGLADSQAAADTFGTKLSNVGGAVVMGGLTAAATATVAIGTAAFDAAEKVDEAYDKIAVATGATGLELEALQDDFKAVYSSVPTDAESAATAIGILNSRLDISGPALQEIAKPMLEVTRLMGGDLTANAENFTRVMGDWVIPVSDASGSLDALYLAAQNAGVPLDQLMERIVQYGAPMRNYGFTFEEAATLMAQWEAQGVNVEIMMSGLRTAAGGFIKDGVNLKTGLWETIDAIQNASSATEGMGIAYDVFGAKAAADMYDTIMAGKFDIDAMVESMQNAEGAILDTAAATADWPEIWERFKNSITVSLAPIGEEIRSAFSGALDQLSEVFSRPDVQAGITQFATAVAESIGWIAEHIPTAIEALTQFVGFLQENQGVVIGVFAALGVAVVAWGVVTAAAAWAAVAPFLPVIGVLLLVAGAAYLLYQAWVNNWGGIQEKTQEVWAVIQQVIDTLSPKVQEIVGKMTELFEGFDWGPISEALSALLPVLGGILVSVLALAVGIVDGLLTGMSYFLTFAGMIAEGLSNIFSGVINIFSGFFGFLYDLFTGNFDKLGEDLLRIGQGVLQVFDGLIEAIVGIFGAQFAWLIGFVVGFVDGIISTFQSLYDALVGHSIIPDMVDAMLGLVVNALTAILSAVGGWVSDMIETFTEVVSSIQNVDWESIAETVVDWLAQIPDMLADISWQDIGTNIMQGISNGILGMIGTVIETAMYAGQAILDALQGFFGIQSPSALMKTLIGENLGLGVLEGWESVMTPMVLQPAVADATVNLQARSLGAGAAIGAGAVPGADRDSMLMSEMRSLIRGLPNEIARAVRTAVAKGNA